jgi:hypothetical protein
LFYNLEISRSAGCANGRSGSCIAGMRVHFRTSSTTGLAIRDDLIMFNH